MPEICGKTGIRRCGTQHGARTRTRWVTRPSSTLRASLYRTLFHEVRHAGLHLQVIGAERKADFKQARVLCALTFNHSFLLADTSGRSNSDGARQSVPADCHSRRRSSVSGRSDLDELYLRPLWPF
ncbi:hypothetical protein PsYK624_078800 [Phanerochaete sordida]|uniref:Uncharacterized protein n=1 Tax=Phanerochaete sordida TaxID=48140 RepID=A0A9P3GDC1_9APHY|nr:hypothetical protein PsYK624_078800 [Phanerochaete sordida]